MNTAFASNAHRHFHICVENLRAKLSQAYFAVNNLWAFCGREQNVTLRIRESNTKLSI